MVNFDFNNIGFKNSKVAENNIRLALQNCELYEAMVSGIIKGFYMNIKQNNEELASKLHPEITSMLEDLVDVKVYKSGFKLLCEKLVSIANNSPEKIEMDLKPKAIEKFERQTMQLIGYAESDSLDYGVSRFIDLAGKQTNKIRTNIEELDDVWSGDNFGKFKRAFTYMTGVVSKSADKIARISDNFKRFGDFYPVDEKKPDEE